MRIEHVAVWVEDLEKMAEFYQTYFGATRNNLYHNPAKGFMSYFLTFSSGARLELMHSTAIDLPRSSSGEQRLGWTHLALGTGSEERVDELTKQLRADGYQIMDGPRRTGDGYYESVVLDPEGNRLEITV